MPKAEKWWCVVNPKGKLLWWTVAENKNRSISRMRPFAVGEWREAKKRGYRVVPISVTPIRRSK